MEMSMKDRNISVLTSMVYIKRTDFKVIFSLTTIHKSIYSKNILFSLNGAKRKA